MWTSVTKLRSLWQTHRPVWFCSAPHKDRVSKGNFTPKQFDVYSLVLLTVVHCRHRIRSVVLRICWCKWSCHHCVEFLSHIQRMWRMPSLCVCFPIKTTDVRRTDKKQREFIMRLFSVNIHHNIIQKKISDTIDFFMEHFIDKKYWNIYFIKICMIWIHLFNCY